MEFIPVSILQFFILIGYPFFNHKLAIIISAADHQLFYYLLYLYRYYLRNEKHQNMFLIPLPSKLLLSSTRQYIIQCHIIHPYNVGAKSLQGRLGKGNSYNFMLFELIHRQHQISHVPLRR